ncbi:MAG TPA: tyrosine-type recombinase/integrase [Xenococcaceae cyanobacterium]
MLQMTAQLPLKAKSCAPPPKKPSTREREYLRTDEIRAMIRAAKKVGRHGIRDGGIILLMFRHGLRTAELVALKWTSIDLVGGYIEVRRVKHGRDSIHPLRSPELRALRQIQKDYLRHACGYYLAAQGHDTRAIQDYLGHKNIHHTVRYTQMSPQRFENFWMD